MVVMEGPTHAVPLIYYSFFASLLSFNLIRKMLLKRIVFASDVFLAIVETKVVAIAQ